MRCLLLLLKDLNDFIYVNSR